MLKKIFLLTDRQIKLSPNLVRLPNQPFVPGLLLISTVIRWRRIFATRRRRIGIPAFGKVAYEVEHGLCDSQILATEVLGEMRQAADQRQSKDVGEVFTSDATQAL